MNLVLDLGSHPIAHRLGWTLVHSTWQGALAALLLLLLRSLLRRCSANAIYLLACVLLFGLGTAPLITFFCLSPGQVIPSSSDSGLGSMLSTRLPASSQSPADPYHPSALSTFAGLVGFVDPLLPWLVLFWLVGVMFLSGRWLQGYWWVRRLSTIETNPLDTVWLQLLDDLKARFSIKRRVGLVSSALAQVPMVIGWLRPVILLPASSLTNLTPSQLELILAHELAHVRRCDYVVNAFQNVIETVMFYHPAVWWISRCIRQEREHCCDDLVVKVCQKRLVYARALFRLEELRGNRARLVFAASGGSLIHRIRRLVAPQKAAGPITLQEVSGLVVAVLGCVLVLLGCSVLLEAESYSSTVRMKIEHPAYAAPATAQQSGFFSAPYFVQTEFEVIQSEVILGKVIEDLNLDKEWSRKYGRVLRPFESVALLRRQMELHPIRNTSIIELRVYDPNPGRAAEIANQIADTYRDFRREEVSGKSGDRLEVLLKQLKEQEAAISQLRNTMQQQHGLLQIEDNSRSREAAGPRISAEVLRKIEQLRIESEAEYQRSKSLLDQLKAMAPDQLAQAIPGAGIQDSLLGQLQEQLSFAKQKLSALTVDYGPEHSEVRTLSRQISELQQKVDQRTTGVLQGLSAKVDSLAQGINTLSNEVARATQVQFSQANATGSYAQTQRDLEDQQEIRKMLLLKIASEKTEVQLPKNPPVQIVDRAFPPSRPSTPNRPRAISFIGLGALAITLGLLLARKGNPSIQGAAVL